MRARRGDLLRARRSVILSSATGRQAEGTLFLVADILWQGADTDLVRLVFEGSKECDIWLDEDCLEAVSSSESEPSQDAR